MVEPRRQLATEKDAVDLAIAYVFREHAAAELAEQHGVSSQTVRRRLRDFGVRVRSSAEQRECDQRRGRYNHSAAVQAAWARGEYETDRFRETRATGDWGLDRVGPGNSFYGKRHTSESIKKMSVAANARVLPGIGSYGDDWTPELRGRIATRDRHRCQVCEAADTMLQIHHVDHDRTNNEEKNLLTVCAPCHLAYHGRGELQKEIRAACARLVGWLQADHEALP